jgi:hypothetical protein
VLDAEQVSIAATDDNVGAKRPRPTTGSPK